MVSNDNYITVDVFEARMDRLEAVFEKYIAVMRQENAEFKAQMKDDMAAMRQENAEFRTQMKDNMAAMRQENAEFRVQMKDDMNAFKDEVRKDISTLENKMNSGFEKVHTEIGVLQRDVVGLKHDVSNLYHWNYWLLSIILVVLVMPQVIAGIKSFFGTIAEGMVRLLSLFRQEKKIS